MLTIICVQVGNYLGRGEEYVRTLYDMVARNIAVPFQFVCVTDDPVAMKIRGVTMIQAPRDLEGWWVKLWMFEHFREGPYLYLDLDTAIVGPLERFAEYDGPLMMLRDFFRKDGFGSALMLWSGDHSRIWDEWIEAGQPMSFPQSDTVGDQAWMEMACPIVRIAQDQWPGLIVSYKRDCVSEDGNTENDHIPMGASVVCFHGRPRPHQIELGWVPEVWRVGGLTQPRWIQGLNNSPETMLRQADENLSRDTAMFVSVEAHQGVACLVGGGPSLEDTIPNLRLQVNRGAHIFALNGTHDWLIEHGFHPDFMVMCDSRADNVQFVRQPNQGTMYLIASVCHPAVFQALRGAELVQWVPWMEGIADVAAKHDDKPIVAVGGGNTVGLKAMYLAHLWGYRHIRLYGFDSCYRDGQNHAYRQALNDGEMTLTIKAAGKEFHCARWMARQADDFQKQANVLLQKDCRIEVLGEGLIPHIWKTLNESRIRSVVH